MQVKIKVIYVIICIDKKLKKKKYPKKENVKAKKNDGLKLLEIGTKSYNHSHTERSAAARRGRWRETKRAKLSAVIIPTNMCFWFYWRVYEVKAILSLSLSLSLS